MSAVINAVMRTERYMGDLYRKHGDGDGLTRQQYIVLNALADHPRVNQTEMVHLTGMDRSTLSELLNRMHHIGFISKQRMKDELRANEMRLTPEGRRALKKARAVAVAAEKEFLGRLSQTERSDFLYALRTLVPVDA